MVLFETLMPHLNERQRRILTGAVAEALGRGGQQFVVAAAGISTSTMSKAVREIRAGVEVSDRQRVEGGGDRPAIEKQPGLLAALDELVHPDTRGNPMSPLRWTLKSTYELSDGSHIAAAAGTWLCLIHGFAGLTRGHDDAIYLQPRLPAHWDLLAFPVHLDGQICSIEITH